MPVSQKEVCPMLLNEYQLRIVLPECNFSAQTVNAIATVSQDISSVFPYLNAVLKGFQYNDQEKILTIKRKGHLITFRPREIAITKLEDEKEAREVMEELKQIVNETDQNREHIKPDYNSRKELKSSEILKFLPKTNCKECGEQTCFAFSYKLVRRESDITKCTLLFSEQHREKRESLLALLQTSGYEVPEAYLPSHSN